jgi:hypothetical protein
MAVQWFYGASHAKHGPFTANHLKELMVSGRLLRTDMVWKEGVKNGLLAGDIRGLFESLPENLVVAETANLPILPAILQEAVALPIAPDVPIVAVVVVQAIISEDVESKVIPTEQELALLATNALLALVEPTAPIKAELEPPPVQTDATGSEPKNPVTLSPEKPKAKPPVVKFKRGIAESGAIITGQDADRVRYRKKCVRCGFEESTNSVLRLVTGINRVMFFCPKCRKQVGVAIRAV